MAENMPHTGVKKPRAKYEWLIIVIVLVAGIGVTFGLLQARGKAQKSELLMRDLSQLRSAVALYKTVKKANPPSLDALVKETYNLAPGEAPKPFVSNLKLGRGNQMVDPFGNTYAYDLQKGWVHSTTKGFESW